MGAVAFFAPSLAGRAVEAVGVAFVAPKRLARGVAEDEEIVRGVAAEGGDAGLA